MKELETTIVKAPNGYFFTVSGISSYLDTFVDDKNLKDLTTFNSNWYRTDSLPKIVKTVRKSQEFVKWVLKAGFPVTEMTPAEILDKDYFNTVYDDEDNAVTNNRSDLFGLYTSMTDEVEEVTEYKLVSKSIIKSESIEEPIVFQGSAAWNNVTEIKPQSDLLALCMFPNIMLPTKGSALSSEALYKIIRYHIKTNIDGRYAQVTSDYDFCFTVEKRILHPPVAYTFDDNLFTKKKPKYKTAYQDHKNVTLFKMTSLKDSYRGYPVLPGISAKSQKELKQKVETVLNDLMTEINKPLVECSKCHGAGVEMKTKEIKGII